ncbi:MAG: phage tail tape measure protein [Ferruginibacter sp.]|nr:phage tail tape measure protein [Ferruginibacter sp.]
MTNDILYNLMFKIGGDNKILSAIDKIKVGMDNTQKSVDGVVNSISRKLNAIRLDAVLNNINRVSDGFNNLANPGNNLSTQMFDLQANTGVAGQKLQEIERYARSNAKVFGGDAADSVRGYNLLLSKLTPEIANTPAALDAMGNSVSVLSKRMSGDTVAATEVLTTAMNQYQVSTADPIAASKTMANMMNVMVAGAREGSAELPQVSAALEQAGMAAKGANIEFEETNAAIQVLDKAGKKGAEGGVALRNTLAIIGQGRFLPPQTQKAMKAAGVDMATLGNNSLPLATRLKALTPIMNDSALLTKLFGMENQNAARALISGIPEIERITKAVTGTNAAYEQAAIVMDSPAEKNKRLQARVDDLKISLFNGTNGWLGYAGVVSTTTRMFTDMMPLFSVAGKVFSTLTSATKLQALWTGFVTTATTIWSGAMTVFNAIMAVNPIVWVVAAIIGLIAVISYVIYKTDGWGKMWQHTVTGAALLWKGFVAAGKLQWDTFITAFEIGILGLEKGWYKLMVLMKKGGAQEKLNEIDNQIKTKANSIINGAENVKKLFGQAGAEFVAGGKSLSINDKTLSGLIGGMKKEAGIDQPQVQGATTTNDTNNGKGQGNGTGKKTNEAIATGGTKSTNIHITIGNQVGTMKIEAGSIGEGAKKMRDTIVDELTRAIAMGASLGGANG